MDQELASTPALPTPEPGAPARPSLRLSVDQGDDILQLIHQARGIAWAIHEAILRDGLIFPERVGGAFAALDDHLLRTWQAIDQLEVRHG